ncbi:MAG: hypothetical protein PUI29_09985 [Aeromonadales bacterium]|jgi:hypothetical protein|nr:hypothetical protein [Aeromonadales bacterium]MDY2890490.1 hypothetical protein [Succinivibrio sp.]
MSESALEESIAEIGALEMEIADLDAKCEEIKKSIPAGFDPKQAGGAELDALVEKAKKEAEDEGGRRRAEYESRSQSSSGKAPARRRGLMV